MRRKRKYVLAILTLTAIVLMLTLWANTTIIKATNDFITGDIDQLTDNKVGLLLGTNKNLSNGYKNAYFYNRIDATVELFEKGKIKYVIVSGDNGRKAYNEPFDMKLALIQRGIDSNSIFLDYAGFRTFDSVIRAKEIFGQTSFTIISQKFHNERAVYIARRHGIEAFAYNAKDVTVYKGFKTKLRELLARDKMFLDMAFNVQPKYLGDKIVIQ